MSRTLRFCMVTTFYPPHHFGGDAMYVHRLSHELARRGHDVTVVYPPDAFRVLGGEPLDEVGNGSVHVHRLGSHFGALAPTLTYLTGRPSLRRRELRRILDEGSFDVIHFHNVSLVGGPGVLAYGGEGVKLYTAHEHWLVCPMHVLWKNNSRPCDRPQCLRCTLTFRRPPQLWRYTSLLERSVEHVDLFLTPSRFAVGMHRERGFRPPVRHLPYFVPGSTGDVEPYAHDRPYFLAVGRLERPKGIQTLIDAFARYRHADLLVAGEGTYGRELRSAAAGLSNVTFVGKRSSRELQALYAGAVALLQPSIGYETFGMTIVEAFVHGTPAIVRALGALPEIVADSGGGFTYTTNDELIDAMERLRLDDALRTELGERGRRAHRELWSEEAHLHGYFDAISDAETNGRARLHSRAAGGAIHKEDSDEIRG